MSEFTHAELKLRFAEALDVIDRLTAERDRYKEALERIGKFGWDAYISNIVRNVLEKTPTR